MFHLFLLKVTPFLPGPRSDGDLCISSFILVGEPNPKLLSLGGDSLTAGGGLSGGGGGINIGGGVILGLKDVMPISGESSAREVVL